MFHDYKLSVKRKIDHFKTLRLICGGENLMTMEVIVKLDHLVHNQTSTLKFEDIRRYTFQIVPLQNEMPRFRYVSRQVCFTVTANL